MIQTLQQWGTELEQDVRILLKKHSRLVRRIYPADMILNPTGDYAWEELDAVGSRLQSKVITHFNKFMALVQALVIEQPREIQETIKDSERTIRAILEQDGFTWHHSVDEVLREFEHSLGDILKTLDRLYDSTEGQLLAVPDTNALLFASALEHWKMDDADLFTIVLVPQVLTELDDLKTSHRVPEVRTKAQNVIRRIKEYRRRGSLTAGVAVVKGRIYVRAIAVEPDFERTLPWLQKDNADDRILASFIEVLRQHPRSPAVLVTADLNLQNKAEFAGLPFVEPPKTP